MWNIAADRRIAANQWAMESQNEERKQFFEAVSRNVNGAQVRLGLELARVQVGSEEVIYDQDGDVIAATSDGELIPPLSYGAFLANASFPALDPAASLGGYPNAPKRDARDAPSEEPDSEMPETGEVAEIEMEDLPFTQRHTIGMPEARFVATASQDQLRRAGQGPNRGRPAYAEVFPMGDPALGIGDPISVPGNYLNLYVGHGWVAGNPMEPPAMALAVAGAERVDAGEFRALDANSGLLRPVAGRDFQVWSLPGRKARDEEKRHEWRLGVRLGPNASGELPPRIYDWAATHPGIRKGRLSGSRGGPLLQWGS